MTEEEKWEKSITEKVTNAAMSALASVMENDDDKRNINIPVVVVVFSNVGYIQSP